MYNKSGIFIVLLLCTARVGAFDLEVPLQSMGEALDAIDGAGVPATLVDTLSVESDSHAIELSRAVHDWGNSLALVVNNIVQYLVLQRVWQSASFCFDETTAHLSVCLTGRWVVQSVTIQGVSSDRRRYLRLYKQEIGEPFDYEVHTRSLGEIKKELQRQGYFNVRVYDHFEYQDSKKLLAVGLLIDRGELFSIADVGFSASSEARHGSLEHAKKCHDYLKKMLIGKGYQTSIVHDAVNQLKRELARQGICAQSVEVDESVDFNAYTVKLDFSVAWHPERKILFVGNAFFSPEDLRKKLSSFEESLALVPASILQRELVSAYRAKGFWEVDVLAEETDDTLYFIINEGVRTRLGPVVIHGNTLLSADELLQASFQKFNTARHYDDGLFAQACEQLLVLCRRNGFWDVALVKKEFLESNGRVIPHITLAEGPQYRWGQVSVANNSVLQELLQLQSSTGRIAEKHVLLKQKDYLAERLREQGYTSVDISYECKPQGAVVDVVWHVKTSAAPAIFGKTIWVGNNSVPAHTLIRELCYRPGHVWDVRKVYRTITRLYKRDLFDHVALTPKSDWSNANVKHVIVKVIEKKPWHTRVRLGVQKVSKNLTLREGTTYRIGLSVACRNPFRRGGNAAFNTEFTRFARKLALSYDVPCSADRPLSLAFKGYNNKYQQPFIVGEHRPLYEATQRGIIIGLHYDGDTFEGVTHAGIEWDQTRDLSHALAQAINFESDLIGRNVPYVLLENNFIWNRLDNSASPTTGTLCVLSGKHMIPLKFDSWFSKFLMDVSWFVTLGNKECGPWVAACRVRLGHIFNKTFKNIMPLDRFYLGGAHSIRSYEPDYGHPLGEYVDENGSVVYVPQGGRSMVSINMELRFPIYASVGGVVFQDIGALFTSLESALKRKPLTATGFGLRYKTPIGPVRFDIGWKWSKRSQDEHRYAWFLTVGHAF